MQQAIEILIKYKKSLEYEIKYEDVPAGIAVKREKIRSINKALFCLEHPTSKLLKIADSYEKDGEPGCRGVGVRGWRAIAKHLRDIANEIQAGE